MADTENGTILTPQGLKELEEKLEHLKTVRRAEVAEEIKQARAFGDLSENAEYDEAKNEQGRIEVEIANIEKMLRNAVVVDEVDAKTVNVGTIVTLLDKETGDEEEYKIVGSAEANLALGALSNESPVGKALIGQKSGATVRVSTPGGVVKYKILDIRVPTRA